MGYRTNPIGIRLLKKKNWHSNSYSKLDYKIEVIKHLQIYNYLESIFRKNFFRRRVIFFSHLELKKQSSNYFLNIFIFDRRINLYLKKRRLQKLLYRRYFKRFFILRRKQHKLKTFNIATRKLYLVYGLIFKNIFPYIKNFHILQNNSFNLQGPIDIYGNHHLFITSVLYKIFQKFNLLGILINLQKISFKKFLKRRIKSKLIKSFTRYCVIILKLLKLLNRLYSKIIFKYKNSFNVNLPLSVKNEILNKSFRLLKKPKYNKQNLLYFKIYKKQYLFKKLTYKYLAFQHKSNINTLDLTINNNSFFKSLFYIKNIFYKIKKTKKKLLLQKIKKIFKNKKNISHIIFYKNKYMLKYFYKKHHINYSNFRIKFLKRKYKKTNNFFIRAYKIKRNIYIIKHIKKLKLIKKKVKKFKKNVKNTKKIKFRKVKNLRKHKKLKYFKKYFKKAKKKLEQKRKKYKKLSKFDILQIKLNKKKFKKIKKFSKLSFFQKKKIQKKLIKRRKLTLLRRRMLFISKKKKRLKVLVKNFCVSRPIIFKTIKKKRKKLKKLIKKNNKRLSAYTKLYNDINKSKTKKMYLLDLQSFLKSFRIHYKILSWNSFLKFRKVRSARYLKKKLISLKKNYKKYLKKLLFYKKIYKILIKYFLNKITYFKTKKFRYFYYNYKRANLKTKLIYINLVFKALTKEERVKLFRKISLLVNKKKIKLQVLRIRHKNNQFPKFNSNLYNKIKIKEVKQNVMKTIKKRHYVSFNHKFTKIRKASLFTIRKTFGLLSLHNIQDSLVLRLPNSFKYNTKFTTEISLFKYQHKIKNIIKHKLFFLSSFILFFKAKNFLKKFMFFLLKFRYNYLLKAFATDFDKVLGSLTYIKIKRIKFGFYLPSLIAKFIVFRLALHYRLGEVVFPILKEMTILHKKKQLRTHMHGIMLLCSGRFTRRQRASKRKFIRGNISLSTFDNDIYYSFNKVRLKYGMCGIKIWLNKYKKRSTLI